MLSCPPQFFNPFLKILTTCYILTGIHSYLLPFEPEANTVEPRYNEDLGTMKITLLYQVSHYIRVKKTKKYKELGPAKLPCYKRVLLYPTSL